VCVCVCVCVWGVAQVIEGLISPAVWERAQMVQKCHRRQGALGGRQMCRRVDDGSRDTNLCDRRSEFKPSKRQTMHLPEQLEEEIPTADDKLFPSFKNPNYLCAIVLAMNESCVYWQEVWQR